MFEEADDPFLAVAPVTLAHAEIANEVTIVSADESRDTGVPPAAARRRVIVRGTSSKHTALR